MKNIVICCDGTNNQIEESSTNVFKLFQSLEETDAQVTFYAPGVGTMAQQGSNTPLRRRLSLAFGLAFGAGLQEDYEEAYRFLMEHYDSGDRVFVFGFSRGALTARALAGMVHMFGLLEKGQENLVPYLARSYSQAHFELRHSIRKFTRTDVRITFLGLWDTVSSYGFAFRRRTLPFTANNPIVDVVRHAISLDERRAYFRANRWGKDYVKWHDVEQDVREVWFAGVHSDVGGGYADCDLARIPLQWMLEEMAAKDLTLQWRPDSRKLLYGETSRRPYVPNPCGLQHESLQGAWWAIEFLPKNATLRRGRLSLPLARRRPVLPDAEGRILVHKSVAVRSSGVPGYSMPTASAPITEVPEQYEPGVCLPKPAPSLRFAHAWRIVVSLAAIVFSLFLASFVVAEAVEVVVGSDWLPVLALFVVPMGVLAVGGWLMGLVSGLPKFSERVDGMLHIRPKGYDSKEVRRQVRRLGPEGVRAYRRMLWIDLAFPVLYGWALSWTFLQSPGALSENGLWRAFGFACLGLTMLADWCENFILLFQVRRPSFKPNPRAISIASAATRLKILAYGACVVLPPAVWGIPVILGLWCGEPIAQYLSLGVGALVLSLLVKRLFTKQSQADS